MANFLAQNMTKSLQDFERVTKDVILNENSKNSVLSIAENQIKRAQK